jgi:hypothetical protein
LNKNSKKSDWHEPAVWFLRTSGEQFGDHEQAAAWTRP